MGPRQSVIADLVKIVNDNLDSSKCVLSKKIQRPIISGGDFVGLDFGNVPFCDEPVREAEFYEILGFKSDSRPTDYVCGNVFYAVTRSDEASSGYSSNVALNVNEPLALASGHTLNSLRLDFSMDDASGSVWKYGFEISFGGPGALTKSGSMLGDEYPVDRIYSMLNDSLKHNS